jgi:predicted enzyme related to lactoylglutathione lyase
MEKLMLRGLSTIAYQATDIDAAKRWYTEVLGIEPYFKRPEYVEFRVGDYEHELGILDSKYLPDIGGGHATGTPGGAIAYWYVEDAQASYDRLLALGATPHQPPRDFGEDFVGAAVVDPFGNILGIMHNPHYEDVLGRTT